MVASYQSTISPFIQIFPVPANAIGDSNRESETVSRELKPVAVSR